MADRASSEPTFVRERPRLLDRLLFRAVPVLYRGPLAEILRGRCVMLLTTTGRRSGLPRTTGVSFMPEDGRYVIFSGFGVDSNWYRNVTARPDVTIQVGRRRMRASARVVPDPARRKELMLRMRDYSARCGPPKGVRALLRLTRLYDYEAEIAMAVAQEGAMPVVEILPV